MIEELVQHQVSIPSYIQDEIDELTKMEDL